MTLRAVAARIDVAPALVAHYEPDMQALIASTFASIVSAELDEVDDFVAALPSPRERLAALLATLLDGSRDDVTVIWVEAWAMGRRNETLAAQRARRDGRVAGISAASSRRASRPGSSRRMTRPRPPGSCSA